MVRVISQQLSPETIAIVEATAPDLQERRAAIIFRASHRLETEQARRLLFTEFTLNGHGVGLFDAILATVRAGRWTGRAPFSPIAPQRCDADEEQATLEIALIGAMQEVLRASAMIVNAWREAFRFFMRQLALAPQL